MKSRAAGFRELEHTADWELEVWAPNLPGLLEQAARGMYALAGMRLETGPRQSHTLEVQAQDAESLLVQFLSELLFLAEGERIGVDAFDLHLAKYQLTAQMSGAAIASLEKEIKAVTYHRLKIRQVGDSLQVNIVFDV
jgi:SHS2 domain-containing protein